MGRSLLYFLYQRSMIFLYCHIRYIAYLGCAIVLLNIIFLH
ncbi:hypothetical protein FB6_4241 [Serratia marcescens]|nr:hypothetical protein SMKC004_25820 [Serratia marcescens]CAB1226048.1 hypothetical protein FB6_4241 [Serratia marcescens]